MIKSFKKFAAGYDILPAMSTDEVRHDDTFQNTHYIANRYPELRTLYFNSG